VKLVDSNVLIYATNADAEHHRTARPWLRKALAGPETLLVPWLCAVAYLRISTNPRTVRTPLAVPAAVAFIRSVLDAGPVITGAPDARHLDRVMALLAPLGRGGTLVNDAHLAALAQQYGATVVSYDYDFGLFPDVPWERPAAEV
jgi:toxin-antitoxin system PIN domain toxin